MATSTPQCGVCEHRKQNTPAKVWCHECDEGLCESCQDFHGSVKTSRDHKIIPIPEYLKLPSSLKEINEYCNVHNEKFQTYCKDHNTPCCRKCLIETHDTCKHMVLEDVVENAKSSSSFHEIEQTVSELISNCRKIRNNRKANKERIGTQKKEIAIKIREFRETINKTLDKLEKDILSELSTIEQNERSKIDSTIEAVSEQEKQLLQKQSTIENVKEHASNLQAFLYTQQEENEITQIQAQCLAIEREEKICEKKLLCTFDTGLQNIISGHGVKAFGKLTIVSSSSKIDLSKRKEIQAQVLMPPTEKNVFESVKLKQQQTFNSNCREMFGFTTISNGGILFSRYNEKILVCLDADGNERFKVETRYKPFDIATVDDSTVAISSGGAMPHLISLFNMVNQTVDKTFTLSHYVYGMAIKDNYIYCVHSGQISQINIASGTVRVIKNITLKSTYYQSYLTISNDCILYTNPGVNSVTCCDLTGATLWIFRDRQILRYPMGIKTDDNGLVYVVGNGSNNVVILTPDGKSCKQILSRDDGLVSPTAIHFDRIRNEVVVANLSGRVFKFSVTV